MGLSSRRPAAPSRTLDILGLVAMALFILGPLLASLRLVPALTGFGAFALGGLLALIVTVIGIVRAIRGRRFGRGGMLAAAVAALVFVWVAASRPRGPPIHDFTHANADPPARPSYHPLPPRPRRPARVQAGGQRAGQCGPGPVVSRRVRRQAARV